MNIETIPYGGWKNCLRLSNSAIDAIVTLDVGPRILRFGYLKRKNEFMEFPEQLGKSGGNAFMSYGGHRLWIAPEEPARTYYPDNKPVEWKNEGEAVLLRPPVESTTHLQKELELWMDPKLHTMQVIHRIYNTGTEPVTLAPWAITVMAPRGRAIVPQDPFRPYPELLQPVRTMALWSYSVMNDPRWRWGDKYIQLYQRFGAKAPQKVGLLNKQGWAAYMNQDHLFMKTFPYEESARYPDFNCNAELFTDGRMVEIESLGPLKSLNPGESVQHDEHWFLFKEVVMGETDEEIEDGLERLTRTDKKKNIKK